MTLTELLKVGDEVVFNVSPDQRMFSNTHKDIPDGTKGIVCGFYDAVIYVPRVSVLVHQPGVYHRKGAVSIWLPDGRIVPGDHCIDMVDKDEQKRRDFTLRDSNGVLRTEQIRLGDLPETKFWEQDKVIVQFPHSNWGEKEMTVVRIDYHNMHQQRDDGSPYPFYGVQFLDGGQTCAEESWIKLIERGNVWKYYNQQPLSFANIEEEAGFFQSVGQTEEIRNPKSGGYNWTEDEVLEAIKNGTVHGFRISGGFFGSGPHVGAIRFKDEDLGKRVAKETLQRSGVAA